MNLYFTYESRGTLKSINLFITVKTIAKLNPELSDKFKNLAVAVHDLKTTQNLVISRCLAEDGKEMYQELERTCTAIVLLVNSFVQ